MSAARRIFLFLLIPLPLFLPLLFINRAIFFGNTDAVFYFNIFKFLSAEAARGNFYPRWLPAANVGLGSPAMFFYAPLAYLVTFLLTLPARILGASLSFQFILGLYLSQVFCAFTAWVWLSRRFPARPAMIAAALYVLLPYKLLYIYANINLAQLWALALLPLLMLAAEGMSWLSFRAAASYALMLAAAFYMHPLTVFAFAAVPFFWALLPAKKRRSVFLLLVIAQLLAMGMTAAYVLPAATYIHQVQPAGFLAKKFNAVSNLSHVDTLLLLYQALIASLVWILIRRFHTLNESAEAKQAYFCIGVIILFFALTTPIAKPLWILVPPLDYFQFPSSRLQVASLIASTWLIAYFLTHAKLARNIRGTALRPLSLALFLPLFAIFCGWRVWHIYHFARGLTSEYVAQIHESGILPPQEYFPSQSSLSGLNLFINQNDYHALPQAWIADGRGRVTFSPIEPQGIRLHADISSPDATIMVKQFYFPPWRIRDQRGAVIPARPSEPEGLLEFGLPRGVSDITVEFPRTKAGRLGIGISLVSLLAVVMIGAYGRNRHRRAA